MIAQYFIAYFKHLNNYKKFIIGFLIKLFLALLLFLYSLFIIITSFKFYNLFNIIKDLLNLLLNLPLFKFLISFKLSLFYSCMGGK